MKKKQLNYIQQQASNTEYNIILVASAGTGKTKTLIDRLLRLVIQKEKFSNIFCITFTKNSTIEIINRIKFKILLWQSMSKKELKNIFFNLIGKCPNNKNINIIIKLIHYLLLNIDKINIQTIHKFCSNILYKINFLWKNYYIQSYRLIDEINNNQFLLESYKRTINYKKKCLIINIAIDELSYKYDYFYLEKLIKIIIKSKQLLYILLKKYNSINCLIKNEYIFYDANTLYSSYILRNEFIIVYNDCLIHLCLIYNIHKIKELLFIINYQLSSKKIKNIYLFFYINLFLNKKFYLRKNINKSIIKYYLPIKDFWLKEQLRIKKFINKYHFQIQAEFMKNFFIILTDIGNNFEYLKNFYCYIEYDDLILKTINIINKYKDVEILFFSLNININHLLIDESQDISNAQWIIIQNIFKSMINTKSTIFIVGDYKQSIFTFQGADPEYFITIQKLCKILSMYSKKSWKNLYLFYSLRSKKEILNLIDEILFSMNIYNQLKHITIKTYKGFVTLMKYNLKNIYNFVQIIKNIIDIFYIQRSFIKFRNIMILFHKHSENMIKFSQILKIYNIPIIQVNQINIKNNIIIKNLLTIINFISMPYDNVNLCNLLKSSLINIYEDCYYNLLIYRKKNNIWIIIQNRYIKISLFLYSIIEEQKKYSLRFFYINLLFIKGLFNNFLMYFGSITKKIIFLFIEKIIIFENKYQQGINTFLFWINNNISILSEECVLNGIKLLTCHASKGLESKIVIIAEIYNSSYVFFEPYIWYSNKLIIPYFYYYNSFQNIKIIKEKIKKKEKLRLLYVAITRAKNELYIYKNIKQIKYNLINFIQKTISKFLYIKINILYRINNIIKNILNKNKKCICKYKFNKSIIFIKKILLNLINLKYSFKCYYINKYISNIKINNLNKTKYFLLQGINIFIYFFFLFNQFYYFKCFIKQNIKKYLFYFEIDKIFIKKFYLQIIEIKFDLKNQLNCNNIPIYYLQQMNIYKKCLNIIFPKKKVYYTIFNFLKRNIINIKL